MTPDELAAHVEGMSEDERAEFDRALDDAERARAEHDFRTFALRYFPHYFSDDPAEQHPKLFGDLQALVDWKLVSKNGGIARGLVVAMPRFWAKSTICAMAFPIWLAVTRRRRYIVVVSDSDDQVKERAADIREELETNSLLIADFGQLAPMVSERGTYKRRARQKWTEKNFVLANGARIQAKSKGGKLRGTRKGAQRPDCVIFDDLENDRDVLSTDQRNSDERWFRRALLGILGDGGIVVGVGTMLHEDSLLARILATNEFGTFATWLTDCMEGDFDGGRSRWPSRHPLRRTADTPPERQTLEERRVAMGPHAFGTEMMNRPVSSDTTYFPMRLLDHAKLLGVGRSFVRTRAQATGLGIGALVQAWDFGLEPDPKKADTGDLDYTATCSLGLDAQERICLLRGWFDRGLTPAETRDGVRVEAARMQPIAIGVDDNSFGRLHEWELAQTTGYSFVPIGTTLGRHKYHLRDGVPGLVILFENRRIVLPSGPDEQTQLFVDELVRQLHGWPRTKHDDVAVVFWYAVTLIRSYIGQDATRDAVLAANEAARTGRSPRKRSF